MAQCHARYCGLVRWPDMKTITVTGIPNRLEYSVIVIVHTQFTNVAAAALIQSGGPQVITSVPSRVVSVPLFKMAYIPSGSRTIRPYSDRIAEGISARYFSLKQVNGFFKFPTAPQLTL